MKELVKLTLYSKPPVSSKEGRMNEKSTIYLLTRNIVFFKKNDEEEKRSDVYLTTGEKILVKESITEIKKSLF